MPTQYGSRLDTFLAPDLFSALLSTKATPPADVAIAVADCRESFFFNRQGLYKTYGFSVRERLILRRLGLFCNMADGLVLNNSSWEGGGPMVELNLTGWGGSLGSITVVGTAVTGAGTTFTTTLAPGIRIAYRNAAGLLTIGTIDTVTNDTAATLSAATGDGAGVLAYPELIPTAAIPNGVTPQSGSGYTMGVGIPIPTLNQLYAQEYQIGSPVLNVLSYSGTISVASGSGSVTGTNTKFLSELADLMYIRWLDDSGNQVTRQVLGITSDTALTLASVAPSAATNKSLVVGLSHLRLTAKMINPLAFSTITIDPNFAAKYLNLGMVAEIEHTFDASAIIG